MHDPMIVAHEIKMPWKKYPRSENVFEKDYRESLITIWHVDPEKDGSDDSCGWFMRGHHGDPVVLGEIIKRFNFSWDSSFVSDSTGEPVFYGYFIPVTGEPRMSPLSITTELFFHAAIAVLGKDGGDWKPAERFMQRNLFSIMRFAENPTDSIHDSIVQKYGPDGNRDERIKRMASVIYGWILRHQRPWWKHPKWHVWHWKLQIHPTQALRRWLLSRCCICRKGFAYGESPCSGWSTEPAKFLRGEKGIWHSGCTPQGPANTPYEFSGMEET